MKNNELQTNFSSDNTNAGEKVTQDDILKLQKIMNSGINSDRLAEEKKQKKQKGSRGSKQEETITLHCRVCNKEFSMKSSELNFYKQKGYKLPQRCKDCRDKGLRYSEEDYYDRGLKHNTYQENIDMYGPRISVTEGMGGSPGYSLVGHKDGQAVYVREFGENTKLVKDDIFKYK